MRSRDVVSSSSAARLTAPSASISCVRRAISACSAAAFAAAWSSFAVECRFVGLRVGELTRELLGAEPRRLFLELQFGELVAQRLHVALERRGASRRQRVAVAQSRRAGCAPRRSVSSAAERRASQSARPARAPLVVEALQFVVCAVAMFVR